MQLPCRHIFAVRDSQQKPIYSEVGVGNRWRMSYLKQVFGEKNTAAEDCSYEVCTLYSNVPKKLCNMPLQQTIACTLNEPYHELFQSYLVAISSVKH